MSTFAAMPVDPKDLRPLLHRRLDDATDEELTAVHRVLLEFEARRLADELGREMADEAAAGHMTDEGIAASILEHRQKHPYR